MAILNFLISEIFGVAAIFLALIAFTGLVLQKKSFSDVMSGTFKTAIGVIILQQGAGILVGSILPLADAISATTPGGATAPSMDTGNFMEAYGFEIGVAMILGFLLNLVVARFTKWKAVFLTGHMLYWFPFVFVGVGVSAGLSGMSLLVAATLTTAIYYIVAPNLVRPYVRDVIGDDSFTLGHPSTVFVLLGGFLAGKFGDKSKSTEDINIPASFRFLKEIAISGSFVVMITYAVVTLILVAMQLDFVSVLGLGATSDLFSFIIMSGLTFGAGLTVLLLGVRMMIAEIVPAFTGIQEKLIPNAIPAYDCPLLFPYAPNAVIIGFIISTIVSVFVIVITSGLGIFMFAVIPIVITCFFEVGTAAVVGNARGGRRGAYIASIACGVVLVFLMGWSLPFLENSIADWLMVFGGQDFSLWAIIQGLILRVLPI